MALKRQRSVSDLKRALKRRMMRLPQHKVDFICYEFRQFAVASEFFDGSSTENIVKDSINARAFDQREVERAIRVQSERRR